MRLCLGLADEATLAVGDVVLGRQVQQPDRDSAVQATIGGAIHRAHAAGARKAVMR